MKQIQQFGRKIFFSLSAVVSVFIIIQLCFRLGHFDYPADDFKTYFWNNANNIQEINYPFQTLDGEKFLADGNIERFGYTPPLYTYLVAAIIKLGGGLSAIFWVNVFLLAFTISIAAKIFKLITQNKLIIYLSLWILILNPLFINIPRLYLSESLFSFLTISALYMFVVMQITKTWLPYIIALVLLFASIETRTINLYLIPLIAIFFLFVKQGIFQKIFLTLISFAVFFILISSTSNYNSTYLRRTVADGLSRFEGNPVADKLYNSVRPHQENWKATFNDELITQVKNNPIDFCNLYITKFVKAWYGTDSGDGELLIFLFQIIHLWAFVILLILFLIRKLRDPKIFILLLVILYTSIIATGTLSICRYMSPIVPLYVFCTVWVVGWFYDKLSFQPKHDVNMQ
ncbi:MAG: hypothetical protein SGJ10_12910 [Bacteroidota bacterium]|nr:hypothetical protein [Bacteroidota bacterium]